LDEAKERRFWACAPAPPPRTRAARRPSFLPPRFLTATNLDTNPPSQGNKGGGKKGKGKKQEKDKRRGINFRKTHISDTPPPLPIQPCAEAIEPPSSTNEGSGEAEEPAPHSEVRAGEHDAPHTASPRQAERVFVSESWCAPSAETLQNLYQCIHRDEDAKLPSKVTARDPTPTMRTEAVDKALESWLGGRAAAPYVPTSAQLYSWQRQHLISLADPATASLAREAERARPSAMDAASLMEAAHRAGWAHAAPANFVSPPAAAAPHPAAASAEHPAVHTPNLFEAHKAICNTCMEGRKCYTAAGINLLSGLEFPWEGGTPPDLPRKTPAAIPYTRELADAIAELRRLGVLAEEPPENIKAFHSVFDAEKFEPSLSPEDIAAIAADPTGAAAAEIAGRRAAAFAASYEASLGATDNSDGAVRCAWNAAMRASPGSVKHRIVLDMGKATPWFRRLPIRLASLHDFIAACPRGHFIGKFDLSKGYYLVRLAHAASLYCGVCVQLEPGGPPVFLTYRRLPMGAAPSAYLFSVLTGTIREIAQARMPPGVTLHCYLDDFYYCAPTEEAAREASAILLQVFAEVGVADNPKKRSGPSTRETVLGVTIDTVTQTVSLPAAAGVKLATMASVLEHCSGKQLPIPSHALATLAGNLAWGGMVDEILPPFTRSIAACTQGLQPKWWRFTASTYRWPPGPFNEAITAELKWLANHLRRKGLRPQRLLTRSHRRRLYVASDASGVTNCVTVVMEGIAWRFHLVDCGGVKLALLEALALPLVYAHLGDALQDASVVHASDALGACFWAVSGKARDAAANDLCKLARLARAKGTMEASSAWLSRSDNFLADRGAAMPWRQACEEDLADFEPPRRLVEVQVRGLPHDFLASYAQTIDPDFVFAVEAWKVVHSRGT
jgi:hypothetical protein